MFKQINLDNNIFHSAKVEKDKISFNLIPYLIKKRAYYPDIRCYSDSEDCIILNTDINHPVVVWTSEYFKEYEHLFYFLKQNFSDNNPLSLTTKQNIYHYVKSKGEVVDDINTKILGVYKCCKLNNVIKNGYLDVANAKDVKIIANMLKSFYEEALPEEKYSFDYCLEQADLFIANSDTCKVWKDINGDICTIGCVNIIDDMGRISRIYTLPEKRGKSYAKMLVHSLADIVFQKNINPVLYTNFKYAASNKCYQAVGFELLDTIFSYDIKK